MACDIAHSLQTNIKLHFIWAAPDIFHIDNGGTLRDLIQLVKERLEGRKLDGILELLEDDHSNSLALSSSLLASTSSDDEVASVQHSGNSRWLIRVPELIVCQLESSFIAVMIQTLAHRLNYVWVVNEDDTVVAIVTFNSISKILSVGKRVKISTFISFSVVDNIEQCTSRQEVNRDDNPSNNPSMEVEYYPSRRHVRGPPVSMRLSPFIYKMVDRRSKVEFFDKRLNCSSRCLWQPAKPQGTWHACGRRR
ncbi:hypothetical protein Cgig2_022672 [Carnegiea gigantea]|uniref:CBS domain-containing protein n=1 Tax=Carnegiea gigantea TaxID=171969 RepID=A0A9Q1KBN7_9CARY|nr:hypothetical protein Cgig2_022672 [Carnegiea gigantea]